MKATWYHKPAKEISEKASATTRERQNQLLKPVGSLGVMEELAVRLAALQGTKKPKIDKVSIAIFAADHGVTAANISAFEQSTTVKMIKNLAKGLAPINIVAQKLGADFDVVNVGTVEGTGKLDGVLNQRVGDGTKDIRHSPAMTPQQLSNAMRVGHSIAKRAHKDDIELFIGSDLGVGNSTSAGAIVSLLLGIDPGAIAGPGSGLDEAGIARKAAAIQQALDLHAPLITTDATTTLLHLGGFEIAALTGAFIAAAQNGIPFMVDSFVSATAALVAVKINPSVQAWLFFAHRSAEPGQGSILRALDATPILHLDITSGAGTGAALAVPLLQMACAINNKTATLAEGKIELS